jgi:hypothetical protein
MKSKKSIEELKKTLGEIDYCRPSLHIVGGDTGMCIPGSTWGEGCGSGNFNAVYNGCHYGHCNSGDGGCWTGNNNYDKPGIDDGPA